MTIRPLHPQDLPAYFALRTALWPDSADDFELEVSKILNNHRLASFVAEQNGQLVGFVEVSLRDYAEGCESSPVGYLEGWYVVPEHRKTGIGRRLVQAAEDWARAKGCSEMASDSELSNTQGQQAHARLGYQEVERMVCFRKSL
ncbi:aminoglycoside 6'-N-acetyltransferase [Meiothermus taiwanensis]|uniref:Aminoglycoside N(6')-acetyltransferase type 1 n=2 Tax=Meiothermus taiwanensis TaxID=172827 RepID=A0A399DYW2_9DEIN|nr:aminoglycoside 6'-N-acetyltransferase [Meiothermus taiwanensis]AWR85371.1 GCN5-related N-acetyltransferase [Meiothermus taiwanensis WR-220]KIQ55261.1 aminoglycoside 6'-acetyltransferase [Meiothermus taiwanensis]KZK16538.1 aminoglycoside 6'-acetyltransferase [Meiothermus taiwanensis]RIH76583.1 Aminoglycoside N(6')-acetyltransferase type 1 [Meiothermus taiwanensis]